MLLAKIKLPRNDQNHLCPSSNLYQVRTGDRGLRCIFLFGGGAVSPEPLKSTSFYDFPEEIVSESGDWTCHAYSNSNVARCEPYKPPDTGTGACAQKSRDSFRAYRLFVVWFLFHTVCSFVVLRRRTTKQTCTGLTEEHEVPKAYKRPASCAAPGSAMIVI